MLLSLSLLFSSDFIMKTGKETIVAGSGKQGYKDGEGEKAVFDSYKSSIAVDQHTGFIYLSEYTNNVIRVIDPQGRREAEQRVILYSSY
jgi:hypothetical protein